MKQYKKNISPLFSVILVVSAVLFFSSCNKALPGAEPIGRPELNPGTTETIGDKLSSDSRYSIYLAVINRAGLIAKLSDPNNEFTVFAPDNDGMARSGIASAAIVDMMPMQNVAAIAMSSVIPGKQFLSTDIADDFPNVQLPTLLKVGDIPGTPLPLEMSVFPSKKNGFWVNNVPVVSADLKCKNGVIQTPYAVVAPAGGLLKSLIYNNPDLSYFKAAIARADSGQTGLSRLDSLLGYAVTNMTVLVPDNNAFKELLFGSIYAYALNLGYPPGDAADVAEQLASSPGVFQNQSLFPVLTAASVRAIIAYHFLARDMGEDGYQPVFRAFSNNFPATPTFYKTLVNNSVGSHPGVLVTPSYTGSALTDIKFTGMGTFPPSGAPPFEGPPANTLSRDNNAVNGVFYIIDKILMIQ